MSTRLKTYVVNMKEFPSAAELARQEADFVPAAGFALIPSGGLQSPKPFALVPMAILVSASVGLYSFLRRDKSLPRRK